MAQILGVQTLDGKLLLEVDQDPAAGGGTSAPVGSTAHLETGGAVGQYFLKIGAADTSWDRLTTLTAGNVSLGNARKLALYPANGYVVDDQVSLNSQDVDVEIVDQASRAVPITYSIPNPGDSVGAADFVLTEGVQTINGDKTFGNDVTITGDLTVNGTQTSLNTTDTDIEDKLITLNKGGPASSANDAGIEFEENATITGYIKMNAARTGYSLKPSGVAGESQLVGTAANQVYNLPDEDGRFIIQQASAAGVVGQIPFFATDERITNPTGVGANSLTWDSGNQRFGVGTSAPSQKMDVIGISRFEGGIRQQENTDFRQEQDVLQTTDGSFTTIKSIPIPLDTVVLVKTMITGRKSAGAGSGSVGDAAVYERTAAFKNVGGTVTRVGRQSDFTAEDVNAWQARIEASGTNAIIEVRGTASDTLEWEATTRIQIID